MSDIPDDIMKTAFEFFSKNFFSDDIDTTTCIAMAIMAERERCAQVALSWATDVRNPQTARFTAGHIATAIRKPKEIESGANAAADSPALAKSNHEEAAQGAENV
jgi:hypothetical protein